jgi:hypothetical protein
MDYRRFRVSARDRAPLLAYIQDALELCGCTLLHTSPGNEAPFRLTFEAPDGERMGIVVYAFLANTRATRNRPQDEHRFQLKYGSKDGSLHEIWQDPYRLYTTLLVGINPDLGFFVGVDPVLHSPTRFFISIEFKDRDARAVLSDGWASWERAKRGAGGIDEPVEIMVGGTARSFLRYIRFERAAKGLDAGHRALLAEKLGGLPEIQTIGGAREPSPSLARGLVHNLAAEFELGTSEILDLIQSAPRLKMAVRGWVAEVHLQRLLADLPAVTECVRMEDEGGPDLRVRVANSDPILIECKNVLRARLADGTVRLDFQRTRASKTDPCTRFYRPHDFDVVAACLHPCTEQWEFRFALTRRLDPHKRCAGRLSNLVRLDDRWSSDAVEAFARALEART